MSQPKVELKNPMIAALLAYLMPGAGHLYQGRWFKAVLYSACILGTFFWGMHLGQWKIVYQRWEPGNRSLGYLSQVLVGLPALPAYIQSQRYTAQLKRLDKRLELLGDQRLTAPFTGRMAMADAHGDTIDVPLQGTITLEQVLGAFNSPEVRGTYTGRIGDESGTLILLLDQIDPKIYADKQRRIWCDVVDEQGGGIRTGRIEGTVPRAFRDWFEVPPDDTVLEGLHRNLGKFFELAQVFTWIAGLLNLLAVWDALEGPAYGYGNEVPEPGGEKAEGEQGSAERGTGSAERESQNTENRSRNAESGVPHSALRVPS